jgi:predicted nucleic acid-binding protein
MNVIVNATPLIALALINRLDLLPALFDEISVPAEVFDEIVVQGSGKPGAEALGQARWLRVIPSQRSLTVDPLLLGLDAGEVAVLLAAKDVRPDWVIIDERQARRVAFAMGLPVKGMLGVLLAAVIAGLLTKQEALEDLQNLLNSGIRISTRWQNWLRAELERI